MSEFKIELTIGKKGLRQDKIDNLSSQIVALLSEQTGCGNITKHVEKVNTNPSRADRLAKATDYRTMASEIVTELADEMEEKYYRYGCL